MLRVWRSAALGVLLLALLGGWSFLARPDASESTSNAAAFALMAAGLAAGRIAGRLTPALPGLLVLAGAVAATAWSAPESLSGDPLAPPLGYMNANGALLLAGAAGAVVASGGRSTRARALAAVVALVLASVCSLNGAQAAAIGCAGLALWATLRGAGPTAGWVVVGVLSWGTPVSLTLAWAAGWLPPPRPLVSAFSMERFHLWREAWDLLAANPVRGVGPGGFSAESLTAADPDLAWAHSYVLQTGAELGLVGLGLLLLVLVWAAAALGRDGLLLGLLLLPASIDYVLHFGGVLLALSLVVGGALSSSPGTGKPWLTPPSP